MKHLPAILALVIVIGVSPARALAIPPPDFLLSFGSQFLSIFSIMMVTFAAVASVAMRHFRLLLHWLKQNWMITGGILVFIVTVIALLALTIDANRQRKLFDERFDNSVEKTLDEKIKENDATPAIPLESSYLQDHPDLPISISNEEFFEATLNNIFILDAREDEEFNNGHYPGSEHIRFSDLIDGQWDELPTDAVVHVICWSGIRGEKVASFLRTKGIASRYLVDGASGWVDDGGLWDGEISFSATYPTEIYSKDLNTKETKSAVEGGAILIDAREKEFFDEYHIPGSVNISFIFSPTRKFEELFAQVPPGSEVITVCDSFLSCFDAKIAAVKLHEQGHTVLGRYTSPANYE